MENRNSKLNTILLLLLIVLVSMGLWMMHDQKEREYGIKNLPLDTTPGYPYGINGDENPQINYAAALFSEWVFDQGKLPRYEFTDFRMDKITLYAEKKNTKDPNLFFPSASNEAYMVEIHHSVKVNDMELSDWRAGNGNVDVMTGWITDKVLYVTIDKKDGKYTIINMGTGPV